MIYWYGMLERGVIPQCYGRDDAWTLTLAHKAKDIETVISAFEELAAHITTVQSQLGLKSVLTTYRPRKFGYDHA